LDFRPIFAAANNRVQYYHQEQDGGTITDADTSFTNLKGTGPASVPALLALPPSFPSVPAGTPAAANVVPVVVQNTGDAPLTITNVTIQQDPLDAPSSSDFAIVSHNCTANQGGAPLQPGALATESTPAVPRGTCTVNVGFRPNRTNTTSVARLQFTSNADDATERVLLAATSTGDSLADVSGDVGGSVPGLLQLSVPNVGGSFGTFVPGVTRTYTTALAATVTATTGNAELTVADNSGMAPGHLVNGSFSLPQPLNIRAVGLGDSPLPAYGPLNESSLPLLLRTWTCPFANDSLTIGLRQSIAAADALRAGT
jgi:hypothetical protein